MILHMLSKMLSDDSNKLDIVNNIKITKKQIDTLKDYKINTNVKSLKELLRNIEIEMVGYSDEEGLPINEHYYILDDLYWSIKKQNR